MFVVSNMSYIRYKNNNLFVDGVSVKRLVSKLITPFYLYSERNIEKILNHFQIISKLQYL